MEGKMSRWGVGPVFTLLSLGYGLTTLLVSWLFRPAFQINIVPQGVLSLFAVILLVMGVPFFVLSVVTVMRAYNADELVTGGIFRCCRHPLYASWVVFLVPSIVLYTGSWLALSTPVFMYYILRGLVKKEEVYLEKVFGSAYQAYMENVPCILPLGFIMGKSRDK